MIDEFEKNTSEMLRRKEGALRGSKRVRFKRLQPSARSHGKRGQICRRLFYGFGGEQKERSVGNEARVSPAFSRTHTGRKSEDRFAWEILDLSNIERGIKIGGVAQTPAGVCAPKAQEGATQCVFQPSDKRRNQNIAAHVFF